MFSKRTGFSKANWAITLALLALLITVSPAFAGAGGIYVSNVSVGGPTGTLTYGTPGSVSYLVSVLCGGGGGGATWPLTIASVLPTGVTASFSPSSLTWSNNCDGGSNLTKTSTLTLYTTAATPGGVSSFSVSVNAKTGSGSLTVHGITLSVQGFVAQSKAYDGSANVTSISSFGSLSTGVIFPDQVFLDHSAAGAVFSDKFVGDGKTVTAYGYALTGAQASNYSLLQPTTFANITKRDLHIFVGHVDDKVYDSTTTAVVTLTNDAVPGDQVFATGVGNFDSPNWGSGKQVTVSSVGLSGSDAGNYNPVTSTAIGSANISQRPLTVTAVAASKQYDGTMSSSGTPNITSGALQGSDTAGFFETFSDKNVGTGKTLTPAGAVSDGNGGNNYSVTFVPNSGGVITVRPLTVSALGVNRVYDGTTGASVGLSDNRAIGDVLSDSYTGAVFTDKNVGTGKAVSVSGISISGPDAGNYSLSNTGASTTADITKRDITVSPAPNTKVYDGGLSALSAPTVSSGSLAAGDAPSFTEAYSDKNAGSGKVLVTAGSVIDGNSGNNYNVTFASDTNGVIQAKPITTVHADNQFISGGSALPAFTFQYGIGDLVAGDSAADIDTPPTCGVAVTNPAPGSYPITCSGGLDANYDFSATNYVDGTLTVNSVNNPPSDIILSNNSVGERLAAGAIVGNLTTADADSGAGETYSYSLSSSGLCAGQGADNGSFSVSGLTSAGPVPLQTAASLHYVTKSSYNVCVVVDDGHGGFFGKPFVVNVLPSQMVLNSWDVQDGWIEQFASGNTTGSGMNSTSTTLVVGDDKANMQYRSFLTFRTGPIDDNATIVGITIRIKKSVLTNPNLFSLFNGLRVDVVKPYFGSSIALQLTDFAAPESFRNACSFNSTPDANGWYSTSGQCLNALPYINKVGPTQFRLRFAFPTNNNGVADYLSFFSGNAGPLSQPQLIINYSIP